MSGNYDDLITVTMTIRGRAASPEDATDEVDATLRRFLRDDVRRGISLTVAPVGYEAEVTLWPLTPLWPVPPGATTEAGQ